MKKQLQAALSLGLLLLLSGCPTQSNAVNISIDPELLESISGTQAANKAKATGSTQKVDTSIDASVPVESVAEDVEAAIFQAIDDNANALNTQNGDAFIRTIHPQSQINAAMPDLFILLVQSQTRYNILDKQLQSKSESAASVLVQRRTSDLSGTINQEILYTMRTDGDQWKVFFMTDQSNAF